MRGGHDTDTVAAIAGGLLGARWGVSANPGRWRRLVHGYPGLRSRDLVRLGVLTARAGRDDAQGWPSGAHFDYRHWPRRDVLVELSADDRILLGGVDALQRLPSDVTGVVSLCRLGRDDLPSQVAPAQQVEYWLVDGDRDDNPNLEFLIDDAASTVAELAAEGRVLVHCVQAESRTPTVAARYLMVEQGLTSAGALDQVQEVLPSASPRVEFRRALQVLATTAHVTDEESRSTREESRSTRIHVRPAMPWSQMSGREKDEWEWQSPLNV